MTDIAIRVDNLSKKYFIGNTSSGSLRETIVKMFGANGQSKTEEFWALKDVSFEAKQGEAIGIIGKNGAGKSTLLKILSRITEPTKGKVEIEGRVSSLLEVGTGFHPELTGRENVFLNGTILGMKRQEIKAKFDEIVEFSGVEKFLDTPVKRYSSGMKVRLAFAVAAHLEPEILIIDEVLAVGDAEFQKKCLGKMEDVTGQGRTVIFVSHNMGAISALCSKGILISNGSINYEGDVNNAIKLYLKDASIQGYHSEEIRKISVDNSIEFLGFSASNLENGEKILICGDKCKFTFSFRALKSLQGFNIGIGIFNDEGQRVTRLSMQDLNTFLDIEANQSFSIDCVFDKLPFVEGNYVLSLGVFSDKTPIHVWRHALSFNVNDGDYYQTAPIGNKLRLGPVLLQHNWKINELKDEKIN